MHIQKSMASLVLITIFIIIFSFTSEIQAKSLYVDMHNDAIVKAYKITGDQIQYQTDAQNSPSYPQGGPVGITLDPDSGFAFVTSEGERSSQIDLYNAKTMVFEEILIQVEGSPTLAGIVFDKNKQKLYVVGRETSWLFVFFWYEPLKILLPDGETYKILNGIDPLYGAYGMAKGATGSYSEAIGYFRRAIKIAPSTPQYRFMLIEALIVQKNYAGAQAEITDAIDSMKQAGNTEAVLKLQQLSGRITYEGSQTGR